MLRREQNELLTRTGPGTPAGELLRRYWQPVALSEELHTRGRLANVLAQTHESRSRPLVVRISS